MSVWKPELVDLTPPLTKHVYTCPKCGHMHMEPIGTDTSDRDGCLYCDHCSMMMFRPGRDPRPGVGGNDIYASLDGWILTRHGDRVDQYWDVVLLNDGEFRGDVMYDYGKKVWVALVTKSYDPSDDSDMDAVYMGDDPDEAMKQLWAKRHISY